MKFYVPINYIHKEYDLLAIDTAKFKPPSIQKI